MNCKETKNLLPDFIQGNLDEGGKHQIQQHLSVCPACRTEFETLGDIWSKLELLPEEQPGDNLRPKFYAMVSSYKAGLSQSGQKTSLSESVLSWTTGWWPRKPAFQFGFAMLFFIIGLVLGPWFFTSNRFEIITQLQEEVRNMNLLVSLSLLKQNSPSDRLKGVSWTNQITEPDPEVLSALIYTLNEDPNVNVRLAAAEALSPFVADQYVKSELLRVLKNGLSPLVQIELIDILVKSRDKESIPVFQKLIQDEKTNKTVRQRAQWGIQQLS